MNSTAENTITIHAADIFDGATPPNSFQNTTGNIWAIHLKDDDSNPVVINYERARKRAQFRELGRNKTGGSALTYPGIGHGYFNAHLDKLERRVWGFNNLCDGWDGDNARGIPTGAVYASLNFIDTLKEKLIGPEPTSAAPSPDGEVVLYWHSNRAYAELNFDAAGQCVLCFSNNDTDIQVIEDSYDKGAELTHSALWKALSTFLEKEF